MRVNIFSKMVSGPWGGGNQFQKSLIKYLKNDNIYVENAKDADVILVNGHQWIKGIFELYKLKKRNTNLVIVHRVDGPMVLARGNPRQIYLDVVIRNFNRSFADATIFQSEWSRKECFLLGFNEKGLNAVIHNAPDNDFFYNEHKAYCPGSKIRIIATSWSANKKKGFDILEYLDNNLDFDRFELKFVGNTMIKFHNIITLPAMKSLDLGNELRGCDIYLQTSEVEACSNALLEAVACGIVPIARDNSSHPELIENYGGALYCDNDDVIRVLEEVSENYMFYSKRLSPNPFHVVGEKYKSIMQESVFNSKKRGVSLLSFLRLIFLILKIRMFRL